MRFEYLAQPGLPCLAWTAEISKASHRVIIRHGTHVEITTDWCVEGVWAGPYSRGDFDQTDLIFGSGVRLRGDAVHFVSSAATVDAIWFSERRSHVHVSNSLPCLLAATGSRLLPTYEYYHRDIDSITRGLDRYCTDFAVDDGHVHMVAFDNLLYLNGSLRRVSKVPASGPFADFDSYTSFLMDSAEQIGLNSADSHRSRSIELLSTISSGYDSAVASLVSTRAGCRNAVTFSNARARRQRSDSGEQIAHILGMNCQPYDRGSEEIRDEICFWAAHGDLQDGNMSAFTYPAPVCLLFSGYHGDAVWDRKRHNVDSLFVRTGSTGTGLSEFRLIHGVIHTPVPFWGGRYAREIQEISFADEMKLWSVGGDYDRPICRRLLEEAGVPRTFFGTTKSATSLDQEYPFPVTPALQERFVSYAGRHGIRLPNPRIDRLMHNFDRDILGALRQRIPWLRIRRSQRWNRIARSLLFTWSNNELASTLEATGALRTGAPSSNRANL